MRKTLMVTLLIGVVALLPMLWVPVARATPPIPAEGNWTIVDITSQHIRFTDDGNMIVTETDFSVYDGTFEGTAEETVTIIIDLATFECSVKAVATFTGSAGDRSGTLVIRSVGRCPFVWGAPLEGQWVILHGTDELVNFRGQGTWYKEMVGVGIPIFYWGQTHFEAD